MKKLILASTLFLVFKNFNVQDELEIFAPEELIFTPVEITTQNDEENREDQCFLGSTLCLITGLFCISCLAGK